MHGFVFSFTAGPPGARLSVYVPVLSISDDAVAGSGRMERWEEVILAVKGQWLVHHCDEDA